MSTQSAPRPDRADASPSPWLGILGAVAVCGAVPASWNLALLAGLHHGVYLVVYFGLNLLLPFALGSWALKHSPTRTVGVAVCLGLLAGLTEAVVEGVILTHVVVDNATLVLAPEDYVAWAAIVCLFIAGGLSQVRREAVGAPPHDKQGQANAAKENSDIWNLEKIIGVVGVVFTIYGALK